MPDGGRGCVRCRIEELELHAQRNAGEPEHAAELAPAEHRDRRHRFCLVHVSSGRTTLVATVASVIVLAAVLGLVAWGRVPDALAAVPAALLVVVLGLVTFDDAVDVLDRLLPTLVFLASIFVIAEAVRAAGLFERAGAFLSRRADTSVRRLLLAISVARGGFFVVSQLGGEPTWAAAVGAGVLAAATVVIGANDLESCSRRRRRRVVRGVRSQASGRAVACRSACPTGAGFWALSRSSPGWRCWPTCEQHPDAGVAPRAGRRADRAVARALSASTWAEPHVYRLARHPLWRRWCEQRIEPSHRVLPARIPCDATRARAVDGALWLTLRVIG